MQLADGALGRSAEARTAFLDEQCGDDMGLRSELESLLASDIDDWTLGAPRAATAIRDLVTRSMLHVTPGEIIEGFRVGSEIGSGGMGVVYEAEQDNPRRTVALKVLHTRLVGTDSGQRFAFESEVLGRLSHPHLAQVLQAGTYAIGDDVHVPWFAMELVEGALSITGYCREYALPIEARLRLFLSVCAAIHHGHQHGVIHRDIKPANVLVDGEGRVKVIDFSIAAATNRAEAVTMLTRTGDLLGTLPYMAPEQVTGPRDGVDTRTDVYALGVLLFELLTGELPIDMSGMSLADSVRQIVEQPCRRPRSIQSRVGRELDWIVLKALEKEPGRRYVSASELQVDVVRFLAGDAVQAGQPSVAYGAMKALQRHSAVASVVALMIVGSLGFGAYKSNVADDQTQMAAEQQRLKEAAVKLAEEARAMQAEAHIMAAGIAAEQGLWGDVVESLDRAMALGVEDHIGLGLDRVVALVARGDYPRAAAALDALEGQEGAGGHMGQFLLYRGLMALADKDSREEGLPLLEMALGRSLPLADAAFATGMTARTAADAIAAFRQAIAIDSSHSLAWGGLLNALVAAGRLREAERTAESLRFRFPQDKRVHAYHVLFAAMSGDEVALEAAMDEARPLMSASELGQVPTLADWLVEFDRVFQGMVENVSLSPGFLVKAAAVLMSSEGQPGFEEELLLGSVSAHQRFIVDSFGGLSEVLPNLLLFRWDKATGQLDRAIAINPNPVLRFCRALVRTFATSKKYKEMAADFEAAAELDIFPNVALFAKYGVLQSRTAHWKRDSTKERAQSVLEALWKLERVERLPPLLLERMATYAYYVDAFDQCRAIISRWQRVDPSNLGSRNLRIRLEMEAGHWVAARIAILDLLDQLPDDDVEREFVLRELGKVQTALSQSLPSAPVPQEESRGQGL
jgi:tetratricopeptide (TPR) repeat protein